MTSADLRDLYQEVIIDHSRKPRNFGEPAGANRTAQGMNPLCGDRTTVFLSLDGDVVRDAGFVGSGCSISTASASMMTDAVKGKTLPEVEALFERFRDLITRDPGGEHSSTAELGKLAVFSGVGEFPARVKCAILAWHALKAALHGESQPVSTE
jgi:nitrogen fixation protein NifU and related proteins